MIFNHENCSDHTRVISSAITKLISQTAERIRKSYPDEPWFALVGLLHDLGKVLALKGEPQWAVVGDIFATGCSPAPNVVFGDER